MIQMMNKDDEQFVYFKLNIPKEGNQIELYFTN